jgi:GntR family transcriptional repressor for pyruvate dehydrogenase complex
MTDRAAVERTAAPSIVKRLPRLARLSDRVVEELEALIVDGTLAAGSLLPSERELGEQFGVSRTVVREALQGLAGKGLVESVNGRGTVVRTVPPESSAASVKLLMRMEPGVTDLSKVMEIRRLLEVRIAVLAAGRRTDRDLAVMADLLAKAEQYLDIPDSFVRYDIEFHMALARATHNELFTMILDSLSILLTQVRRVALRVADTPQRALEHHRAIFAAVVAADSKRARDAMDEHMDEARDTLMAAASGPDPDP